MCTTTAEIIHLNVECIITAQKKEQTNYTIEVLKLKITEKSGTFLPSFF